MKLDWGKFTYPKAVTPQDIYHRGELEKFATNFPDYEVVDFRPVGENEDYLPTGMAIRIFNSRVDKWPGDSPRLILKKKVPKVLHKYEVTVYEEPPQVGDRYIDKDAEGTFSETNYFCKRTFSDNDSFYNDKRKVDIKEVLVNE